MPEINCQVGLRVLSALGNVAVVAASTNLLIRTLTLWKQNTQIKALLITMGIAQLFIGLSVGMMNVGQASTDNPALCGNVHTNRHHELIIFFAYTLHYDIAIFVFTLLGLGPRRTGEHAHSRVWESVYRHGLSYALTTTIVNVPVVVLACLNLNSVMNIMLFIPATTVSVIASSAAVISLRSANEPAATGSGMRNLNGAERLSSKETPSDPLSTYIEITPSFGSVEAGMPAAGSANGKAHTPTAI
ncbi:hypothetical protein WOLCODRAFT_28932 [Wolfiporia cocos MD-104 SS10]|uniref:Uncharacterized protein n=1 Tax=Wolfiporia cocos (strain MD-104) TaxID=742152 RepID=A0A2H3J4F1_WOLCO|nr:hypothetical protein WOLCODRAFT_28932 [Wolfiporia cocos MD-104 SS10]